MQSINRYKLGGNLLAVGASVALLMKAYWLIIPNESPLSLSYRLVGTIFGHWFARLVMPPPIEGATVEFSWIFLIWIPMAAVFIAFLLLVAVKVIRGQFKSDLVPLPVLGVLGAWYIFALLYENISNGINFFGFELKWLLPSLIFDFAIIVMIVGIALIVFNYKKDSGTNFLNSRSNHMMSNIVKSINHSFLLKDRIEFKSYKTKLKPWNILRENDAKWVEIRYSDSQRKEVVQQELFSKRGGFFHSMEDKVRIGKFVGFSNLSSDEPYVGTRGWSILGIIIRAGISVSIIQYNKELNFDLVLLIPIYFACKFSYGVLKKIV